MTDADTTNTSNAALTAALQALTGILTKIKNQIQQNPAHDDPRAIILDQFARNKLFDLGS